MFHLSFFIHAGNQSIKNTVFLQFLPIKMDLYSPMVKLPPLLFPEVTLISEDILTQLKAQLFLQIV